ncbi:MAG: IS110 family transposase [Arenimonas sp.]
MKCKVIGIDLAKNVFQVCGLSDSQQSLFNRSVSRKHLAATVAQWSPCLIAMEACAGAHYWARLFVTMGHTVKLIPPQHVKAFARTHKSDAHDALAIAEAALRPCLHPVPIKSIAQQDMQLLNRLRQNLIQQRTRSLNKIRGFAGEYGVTFSVSRCQLLMHLPAALEDAENDLSFIAREQLFALYQSVLHLNQQLEALQQQLQSTAKADPAYTRLLAIPGFGPIVTAAFLGSVGNGHQFGTGRDLAAWVGLVPKQRGSGGKTQLLGITKNGDRHLRYLLVHAARAVLRWVDRRDDALSAWLMPLIQRRGINCATVALANKLARIAWNVLAKNEAFDINKAFAGIPQ